MGLWQTLFPPRPPADPPENAETRVLWDKAKRLAKPIQAQNEWSWIVDMNHNICERYGINPWGDFASNLQDLAGGLAQMSGLYDFPADSVLDYALTDMGEGVKLRELLRAKIVLLKHAEANEAMVKNVVEHCLETLLSAIDRPPSARDGQSASRNVFRVPLLSCVPDIGGLIEGLISPFFAPDVRQAKLFDGLLDQLCDLLAHAIPKADDYPKNYIQQRGLSGEEAVRLFLHGTPFVSVFLSALPFAIPQAVRFEHAYILAGSGHGKTQTLQHIILDDIERAKTETFGFALIDSQGDLISKISKLSVFDPDGGELAGRLLIIDPNDLKHPAGLNLFDHNLSRFAHFSELEREKIFHGVLESDCEKSCSRLHC